MRAIDQWFTPERRQAIQVFAATLAPLLIMIGFGNDQTWEQVLILLGGVLQFFASVLSLIHLKRGDWGAAWTVIRGALYTLAAVASPSLVILGLYDETTNAAILTGLSLGLSSLSSLLAIFVGKQQQLEAATRFRRA